jgi:hypothetical protein
MKVIRSRCYDFQQVPSFFFFFFFLVLIIIDSRMAFSLSQTCLPPQMTASTRFTLSTLSLCLLMGAQKGLWVSTDNGDTFKQASFPIDKVRITSLVAAAPQSNPMPAQRY